MEAAGRLATEHGFFHWELEFPGAYYDKHGRRLTNSGVSIGGKLGGFDAVIGNPPWERVQVSDDDFFRPLYLRQTGKSWGNLPKSAKEKFKAEVLSDRTIYSPYADAKNRVKALRSYFGEKYAAQGGGTSEMFKLFAERAFCLLGKKSSFGMIIPSAIYNDSQCAGLRKIMFGQTSVRHILSFINTKAIFRDVHRQFNFCVVILHSGSTTNEFGFSYKLTNLLDVDQKPFMQLSTQLIEQISGNDMTVLEANSTDYVLIKKMRFFPVLGSEQWRFVATNEFHMTFDKDIFHNKNTKTRLPLYEGKTISQFAVNGPVRYYIERDKGSKRLLQTESYKISNMCKSLRWPVAPEPQVDIGSYRLAWREVSNAIDYRTMYAAILPRHVFHGHTLWSVRSNIILNTGIYAKQHTYEEIGYLCGLFNSLPFDWYMRSMVRLHVTKTIMDKMPVPVFDVNNFHHANISKLALGLTCVRNEYLELRKKFNIKPINEEERRTQAEAQISAHSAIIYNLDITDLKYICEHFRVFSIKRPLFIKYVLDAYTSLSETTLMPTSINLCHLPQSAQK